MKKITLFLLALAGQFSFAQNQQMEQPALGCGFDQLPSQNKVVNPHFESKFQERIAATNKNVKKTARERIIPLVFHVFHQGETIGEGTNISNKQIYESIKLLNDRFGNANQDPNSTAANIKFVLATKNAAGVCQEGIVRVNMASNANYLANGTQMYTSQPGVSYETLANASRWDHSQFYNVYVVNKIQGATGYAMMPTGVGHYYDRIVIRYLELNSGIYCHEMGHAMNLYHSFEGSTGTNCPPQTNGCGSGLGDCVSDTPPHIKSHVLDNALNALNTCTQDNNSSFKVNAMTYTISDYMKCFTPQQSLRMETAFDELRTNYHREVNPYFNETNAPTANFLIDGAAPGLKYLCANNSVTLTNISTCFLNTFQANSAIRGYETQWEIIKDGLVEQLITQTNPVVTFTSAGDYTIKLTVTNPAGTHTKTMVNVLKIVPPSAVNYCTNVRSMYTEGYGTSITEVNLGTLTHRTLDGFNGYENFSCTKIALLPTDETAVMNLKITTSRYATANYNLKAFIDYNNNGLFEAEELLGTGTVVPNTSLAPVSINFNIPASVVKNQLYRMRIMGDLRAINYMNCDMYGELFMNTADVEDYSVVFYENLSTAPQNSTSFSLYPNPTSGNVQIQGGQEIIEAVQVYDVNGRLLRDVKQINTSLYTLDLTALHTGIYFVKVNGINYKILKK